MAGNDQVAQKAVAISIGIFAPACYLGEQPWRLVEAKEMQPEAGKAQDGARDRQTDTGGAE